MEARPSLAGLLVTLKGFLLLCSFMAPLIGSIVVTTYVFVMQNKLIAKFDGDGRFSYRSSLLVFASIDKNDPRIPSALLQAWTPLELLKWRVAIPLLIIALIVPFLSRLGFY